MLRAQGAVLDLIDDRALTIYVDGSMRKSPRRGGIGIRFVWVSDEGGEDVWDHALPATMGATNNQMELEAPSAALDLATSGRAPFAIAHFDKIVIRTDSEYVQGNLSNALWVWSKNGWTKSGGAAVLNVPEWKSLLKRMRHMDQKYRLRVNFEWTKGKKGRHAKAVDKLAKQSSDSPSFRRPRPSMVRRKTSREEVDAGSVKMQGQVVGIRIIEARYLPPPHRSSRYKYEVVDEASPYFEKVDWVESDIQLKVGHAYSVRTNQIQENPRIEELLGELEEDLTPYLDSLRALGKPSTAAQVAEQLERTNLSVSPDAVRRRLDQLVDREQAVRTRAPGAGRPYLYEPT